MSINQHVQTEISGIDQLFSKEFVLNPLTNKRIVAVGGGTGLPVVLRALKRYTSRISAIITVADDGGNSGQLRRDYDVLPPGDMRNNIVALADDEDIIAKLFQYRFDNGELQGYALGNIFIAALSQILDDGIIGALNQIKNLLQLRGQVIPATLDKVNLTADVRLPNGEQVRVVGESCIPEANGVIERLYLDPFQVKACPEAIHEIEQAELIVIGPGSLFTSVLPNLLIDEIRKALHKSHAHKVYVCNIATQPGETDNFDLGDHINIIESYLGAGVIDTVIANNNTSKLGGDSRTNFVLPKVSNYSVLKRYNILYGDLVKEHKPWCHDENKVANLLTQVVYQYVG